MCIKYKMFAFVCVTVIFTCCTDLNKVMMVSTGSARSIGYNSAVVPGVIVDDAGNNYSIYEFGHCYSKTSNPDLSNSSYTILYNNYANNGEYPTAGMTFSSLIVDLMPGTIYYVRTYMETSYGTIYGKEISFKTLTGGPGTVTDVDGNVYNTITIGTQTWMKENLRTKLFRDGTQIFLLSNSSYWSYYSSPVYGWYNDNPTAYKNSFGALYNWHAVSTGKLCPTGWHVPSDTEWNTLMSYLGGASVAGGKLKSTGTNYWYSPNTGATNSSGFTALPGGVVSSSYYNSMGSVGLWWSSNSYNTALSSCWELYYAGQDLMYSTGLKSDGFSVRCIKN